MKHLIAPAGAVILSTLGVARGCLLVGMSPLEVTTATVIAFTLSFAAAFVAVILASRPRPPALTSRG